MNNRQGRSAWTFSPYAGLCDVPTPRMAEMLRRFPQDGCYHMKRFPGSHFLFGELREYADGQMTLTLIHARDSTLPGVAIWGIDMGDVSRCGCGQAKFPTKAQCQATRKEMKAAGVRKSYDYE